MRRVSSPTFVGRAEQLASFDHALARAAENDPAALLVAGESGVGKSRLVAECRERAPAAGARVLTGDCIELGEGELPYAPVVGLLRDLQGEVGADALAELAGPGRAELGLLLPEGRDSSAAEPEGEFAQARLGPGRQRGGGPGARARGCPGGARAEHGPWLGGVSPRRGANRCTRLGRLADAQAMIFEALDSSATGLQGGFVHEIAARIAVMTGRYDDARAHVDDSRRLLRRTATWPRCDASWPARRSE